jgi:hypothetical protein
LYSPQALVCAVIAAIVTQAIKALVDFVWGQTLGPAATEVSRSSVPAQVPKLGPSRSLTEIRTIGKEQRKAHWLLNHLLFPAIPIVVGMIYAWVIPYRPESLETYLVNHHLTGTAWWLVLGAWGAVCGQFSGYFFDRAKNLINGFAGRDRGRDDSSNSDRGAP